MSDLREAEARSIRAFVQRAADDGYLSGRVLDYGCGKQPYRDIVEAGGGKYTPWDRKNLPANISGKNVGAEHVLGRDWDAVLCTQVAQYVPDERVASYPMEVEVLVNGVWDMSRDFWHALTASHGYLVLTYPTNWPEVEPEDLHRFTKAGMERLLAETGFEIVRHDFRHGFTYQGVSFAAGYGCIARA